MMHPPEPICPQGIWVALKFYFTMVAARLQPMKGTIFDLRLSDAPSYGPTELSIGAALPQLLGFTKLCAGTLRGRDSHAKLLRGRLIR